MTRLNGSAVSVGSFIALLLVGCLSWFIVRPNSAEGQSKESRELRESDDGLPGRTGSEETSSLNNELRRIRHELATVKGQLATTESQKERAEATAIKPVKYTNEIIAQMTPSQRDDVRKIMAVETYDKLLSSEPRDQAWASTQEDQVKTLFREETTSRLLNASCGSTICRAKIAHNDEASREEFLEARRVIGKPPFNTNCFFTPTRDTTGTVIYCAREGARLPRYDINSWKG